MERKPHACALRRGRFSAAGQCYMVTTVTRQRQSVFTDLERARCLIRCLQQEQETGRAFTMAYVLMPDHLHWLLTLGQGRSLSVVVRAVKAVTAHQIGGVVWQRGFHDRALRCDEDVQQVARYVVANPLRAGLVRHLGDYPHWDAVWI